MASSKQRGFSLLELMMAVTIAMILAGITFISLQPLLTQTHVNAAYSTTLNTLRNYRNRAITERRRYILTFTAPGTLTVQSWAFAVPVSPPPVQVATLSLPPDIQYAIQGLTLPGGAGTPDGFGNGGTAIDFDQNMGLGSLNYVIFMPDGSSQDTQGNQNSGVLYLTRAGDVYNSRAVTVFGSTGRIRGWRLDKVAGVDTWVQQ
jgi:prepilin-type N-terminal cleavage/methylation domain-containing protein